MARPPKARKRSLARQTGTINPLQVVLAHHEDARMRARALCEYAERMKEPYRCPTTRFRELVARLKELEP